MNTNKFILLMLLGVMALELNAKPKYRIETWVEGDVRMYLAQKKVWSKILPFRIWESGSFPFVYKSQAEEIINNWKEDEKQKKQFRKQTFIEFK